MQKKKHDQIRIRDSLKDLHIEIQKRNNETKELEVIHSFETKEAYDNFRDKETTHDLD